MIAALAIAGCSCDERVTTGRTPGDDASTDARSSTDAPRGADDSGRCVVRGDVVVNGSFSDGPTGFETDLTHSPADITGPATFTVSADPRSVHPSFPSRAEGWLDNSPSDDNLSLLVNGSEDPAASIVWRQSVPAVAGVQYDFRAYVRALYPCPCGNISALVLASDGSGTTLASGVAATQLDAWTELSAVWTATETGMVDLVITNAETAFSGNDFAVDDIAFVAEMVPEGCDLI